MQIFQSDENPQQSSGDMGGNASAAAYSKSNTDVQEYVANLTS